jgi:hypothetical protein
MVETDCTFRRRRYPRGGFFLRLPRNRRAPRSPGNLTVDGPNGQPAREQRQFRPGSSMGNSLCAKGDVEEVSEKFGQTISEESPLCLVSQRSCD